MSIWHQAVLEVDGQLCAGVEGGSICTWPCVMGAMYGRPACFGVGNEALKG
eukprot:CAMPEP_0183362988 /NCGR_PEP_ID=MMETSP0164_2-20130417/72769_1 /TAXON_ID=221442 /ORGANISM="Coccolithus pelagicus ssp braarudi, Strain PLY182g" /LENGTH=50 /DNA_ID=CAMNT_0025537989 /DNA_START=175 /DNA_END=323 /DNA_ORIENTATION=-